MKALVRLRVPSLFTYTINTYFRIYRPAHVRMRKLIWVQHFASGIRASFLSSGRSSRVTVALVKRFLLCTLDKMQCRGEFLMEWKKSVHKPLKLISYRNLPKYSDSLNSYYFRPKLWTRTVLLHFYVSAIYWLSRKQCRPWSNAAERCVWSESTLFANACLSEYLE